jgi:N-dimethylarginine dimethylaminohydrolase
MSQSHPIPPRILMCPPDHYGIEYEINPWMNRSLVAVRALAFRQWQQLHDVLVGLGVRVETMTPQPGLPDLVFTANAGLVFHDTFLSSRFRHEVRARESPHFDAWFAADGFRVAHLPENMFHEGAGDALFCGDTLFAGYRTRSDAGAHQWVGEQFGVRVLPLELVNPRFYHLDTCFCPLAPGEALYFPDAFDTYGRRVLATHVPKLLAVEEADAHRFGCNAVVVGKTVVHNSRCPHLAAELTRAGYTPVEVELDEFLKAGGSAKCLTLRLDGEEAAGWKRARV